MASNVSPAVGTTTRATSPAPSIAIDGGRRTRCSPPMNSADERSVGVNVDVGLRPDLLDPAGVHDDDAIRDRECLRLVVRHVDCRLVGAAGSTESSTSECRAGSCREPTAARRTAARSGPSRAHARSATAAADPRELSRQAFPEAGQVHHLEHLVDACLDGGFGRPFTGHAERDVVGHRHVRKRAASGTRSRYSGNAAKGGSRSRHRTGCRH